MLKATTTSLPLFLITLVQRDEDGHIPGQATLCFGHTRQEQGITSHSCSLETPHIAGTMLFFPASSQHLTSKLGALTPLSSSCFSQGSWAESRAGTHNPGTANTPNLPGKPFPCLFSVLILPPPGKSDSDMVSESVINAFPKQCAINNRIMTMGARVGCRSPQLYE